MVAFPVCRMGPHQTLLFQSGIFNFYEMLHHPQHAVDLWGGIVFHRLVHLAKAQSDQRLLLALAFVDGAFD